MAKSTRRHRTARGQIWASAEMNMATYWDYFNRLKAIGMNRIEYEGLPDTIDPRFIERGLWERGAMLWFQDEFLGDLCLPFVPGGQLTVYDIPIFRRAFASNGNYNANRLPKNSVIIYNNYQHLPDLPTIDLFALRIADIQRTIDVNIKGQKTPKIITGPESQRLVMQNLYMQWDGNEPFMFGDKDFTGEISVGVLDTTAPFVADKLEIEKHMLFNEALSYYGIENSNQDKKERLVADEVASNYGLVENSRNVALNSREDAIKQINKMFGHNIKVRFKSEVASTVNDPNTGEREDNGTVYD